MHQVNRQRVFWLALLVGLAVATAFAAFTSSQNQPNQVSAKREAYVRRSLLSPKLVWNLRALGDRIEKPGRERLTLTGTLTRAKESQPKEVIAVFEFPDRLLLTIQDSIQSRVITFDGEQATAAGAALDSAERDMIATLVYGTAEHFFMTQINGQATRFLGSRFRIDDASSADYKGPYYDVYKVADQVSTSADRREQRKLYYFNSETLLLERVRYEINRDGSQVNVEERLGDWAKEDGQQVARRIERFENGESVFVFAVRAAGFSAAVDDGVFTK